MRSNKAKRNAAVAVFERDWQDTDTAVESRRLTVLQRLEQSSDRWLDKIEQEQQAEAQRRRAEAFVELAEIEQREVERANVAIPKIQAAREAVTAARQQLEAAGWRQYELEVESSGSCHLAHLKRGRLLQIVRAAPPSQIEPFIRWLETERRKLAGASPMVRSTVKPGRIWGYRSDPDQLVWESTGETLVARCERLTTAIGEARSLIDEDLTEAELIQRLQTIRDSIPDLEFRPINGEPGYLPEPPLSQRGGDDENVVYGMPAAFAVSK